MMRSLRPVWWLAAAVCCWATTASADAPRVQQPAVQKAPRVQQDVAKRAERSKPHVGIVVRSKKALTKKGGSALQRRLRRYAYLRHAGKRPMKVRLVAMRLENGKLADRFVSKAFTLKPGKQRFPKGKGFFPDSAFFPDSLFMPRPKSAKARQKNQFFPGSEWIPGDSFIPGDAFIPGGEFFPGDQWQKGLGNKALRKRPGRIKDGNKALRKRPGSAQLDDVKFPDSFFIRDEQLLKQQGGRTVKTSAPVQFPGDALAPGRPGYKPKAVKKVRQRARKAGVGSKDAIVLFSVLPVKASQRDNVDMRSLGLLLERKPSATKKKQLPAVQQAPKLGR